MSTSQGALQPSKVERYCNLDALSACSLERGDIDPVEVFTQRYDVSIGPKEIGNLAGSVIARILVDSLRLPCGDCMNDGSIKNGVVIHEFVLAVLAEQLRRNRARDWSEPDEVPFIDE